MGIFPCRWVPISVFYTMKKIQLGGHKKNSLVQGYAIVDDDDFEELNKYKWCLANGYAVRGIFLGIDAKLVGRKKYKYKLIFIHRVIMETPSGMETDHINGNKIDNRKYNLRICTKSQNKMNVLPSKRNTSGFKGCYFEKDRKLWRAYIVINKTYKTLGRFEDKKGAAIAYNNAAKKYFGEFAKLNIVL